jgi:hypothetical protein
MQRQSPSILIPPRGKVVATPAICHPPVDPGARLYAGTCVAAAASRLSERRMLSFGVTIPSLHATGVVPAVRCGHPFHAQPPGISSRSRPDAGPGRSIHNRHDAFGDENGLNCLRVVDPHPGQRRQGACRFRHRRRAGSHPRSVDRILPQNGNRSRHQPADDSQHPAAGVDSAGHPVVRYRRGSQAVPDLLPHILTSCFNACQSAALQKPGCPISAQV